MLLGVISDTHVPDRGKTLSELIYSHFEKVDMILHAGDITDYSLIEELECFAPVKAVAGNMDGFDIAERYPQREVVKIDGFSIGMMHGTGAKSTVIERVYEDFKEDYVDCIVFGHTHQAFNRLMDNVLMFNPGSPTDKRWNKFYSFGLLELKKKYIKAQIIYF